MKGIQLISHPATPVPQVDVLLVALSLAGNGELSARFDCRCRAGVLRLPQTQPAQATDELWRHTCCELFVAVSGDPAYREFNCSPSGQWAMYDFSAYREREVSALGPKPPAPSIRFDSGAKGWTLQARIAAAALPRGAPAQIELGVAVVLETEQGKLSYWALRHAAGQPDFHRRESFVLRLSEID
ncbi:MAG: DOMON-like domain-containing protein [Burkholderiales bacterium]|nr:DOMON-like domain-containing protein [Burkholderiales bacterium]